MAGSAEALLATIESHVTESVAILPGFDEYNGMFMPTIVAFGQVRGTWSRKVKAKETIVEPLPFARLSKTERLAFTSAAEAWGRFIAWPVRVGRVTTDEIEGEHDASQG